MKKICSKCNIEKEFTEFNKNRGKRDGYQVHCRECNKRYQQKYYRENEVMIKERSKKWNEDNKDYIKKYDIQYRKKNKELLKEKHKQFYIKNKEKINKKNNKYSEENREQLREYAKEYYGENKKLLLDKQSKYRKENTEVFKERYKKNRKQYLQNSRKYYKENREQLKKYAKDYYEENKKEMLEKNKQYCYENRQKLYDYRKNKIKTDPIFALSCRIRSLICVSFANRGYTKKSRTHEILGIGWEGLKEHFERQFTEGMNWENRGRWHIDHIIPLATAQSEDDVIRLNHYTNLQPLWAKDNFSKGSKIL